MCPPCMCPLCCRPPRMWPPCSWPPCCCHPTFSKEQVLQLGLVLTTAVHLALSIHAVLCFP
eukprot:12924400-Prorocentrum_lima.AAC.1